MAVKRRKRKSKSNVSEAYEQTILAEGAPAALDLLGFGSTIGDIIRGGPRKAKTRRAKKKARAKVGRPASRKARARVGRPPARRAKKKSRRTARRKSRGA